MKNLIFILITLILSGKAISQKVELSGWQSIPEDKKFDVLLLEDGSHFTVSSKNGVSYPIKTTICFYENLKLKKSGVINPKLEAGRAFLLDVRLIKDKLMVVFSVGIKKTSKIFVQYYSKECQPIGKEQLLIEIPVFTNETNKSNFEYNLMVSNNHDYFSYSYCSNYDVDKKIGVTRYNFPLTKTIVFNSNLKKIHEFSNKETDLDNYLPLNSFVGDNGSFISFIGKMKEIKPEYKLFSEIKMISFNSDGKNEKDFDFGFNSIYNVSFFNEKDLSISLSGLYVDDKTSYGGVFYNNINYENFNNGLNLNILLDKGELTKLVGEKELNKAEKNFKEGNKFILAGLKLANGNVLDNGDFIGVYYYGNENSNLLVTKISNKESDNWKSIIARKPFELMQKSNFNSKYDFVHSFVKDNSLCLFFNDNINNYNEKGEFKNESDVNQFDQEKNFCYVVCELNVINGTIKRSIFKTIPSSDTPLIMTSKTDGVRKSLLFYTSKSNQYNFGSIE